MKFIKHYRPPETISKLLSELIAQGYFQRPLCAYEILRVEKKGEFFMIYERENKQIQSWHPHLSKLLLALESTNVL